MLELNYYHYESLFQGIDWSSHSTYNRHEMLILTAHSDFEKARRRGQSRRFLARLTGRSRALLDLNHVQSALSERYYAGLKTGAIAASQGSEGRCPDFDRDWLPLQSALRQRWTSVYVWRCWRAYLCRR